MFAIKDEAGKIMWPQFSKACLISTAHPDIASKMNRLVSYPCPPKEEATPALAVYELRLVEDVKADSNEVMLEVNWRSCVIRICRSISISTSTE